MELSNNWCCEGNCEEGQSERDPVRISSAYKDVYSAYHEVMKGDHLSTWEAGTVTSENANSETSDLLWHKT